MVTPTRVVAHTTYGNASSRVVSKVDGESISQTLSHHLFSTSSPSSSHRWERWRGYQSPVMRPHDWHEQRRAEEDAGFSQESAQYHVLIPFYTCELCGIGIGPHYYEQEVYLYPVVGRKKVCMADDTYVSFTQTWHATERIITQVLRDKDDNPCGTTLTEWRGSTLEGTWLLCCGGCARNRKRQLPIELRLLGPEHWSTTLLLPRGEQEQVSDIDQQDKLVMAQVLDACYQYVQQRLLFLFLFSLFVHGFPLRPLILALTKEKQQGAEMQHRKIKHFPAFPLAAAPLPDVALPSIRPTTDPFRHRVTL